MNLPVNMAMPDFMIIGTQRGGTTSLYNYLLAHPQIVAATKKEIHFFDKKFQRGIAWYRAQFPSLIQSDIGRQGVITGEASPYYLFHPHAPARAALVVPKTKLIVWHIPITITISSAGMKPSHSRKRLPRKRHEHVMRDKDWLLIPTTIATITSITPTWLAECMRISYSAG